MKTPLLLLVVGLAACSNETPNLPTQPVPADTWFDIQALWSAYDLRDPWQCAAPEMAVVDQATLDHTCCGDTQANDSGTGLTGCHMPGLVLVLEGVRQPELVLAHEIAHELAECTGQLTPAQNFHHELPGVWSRDPVRGWMLSGYVR